MNSTKNGFRDFFHILIGVNIGHVIFGAALGSQELFPSHDPAAAWAGTYFIAHLISP